MCVTFLEEPKTITETNSRGALGIERNPGVNVPYLIGTTLRKRHTDRHINISSRKTKILVIISIIPYIQKYVDKQKLLPLNKK